MVFCFSDSFDHWTANYDKWTELEGTGPGDIVVDGAGAGGRRGAVWETPEWCLAKDVESGSEGYDQVVGMKIRVGTGGIYSDRGLPLVQWGSSSGAGFGVLTGDDGTLEIWEYPSFSALRNLIATTAVVFLDPDEFYQLDVKTRNVSANHYEVKVNGSLVASGSVGPSIDYPRFKVGPNYTLGTESTCYIAVSDLYHVNSSDPLPGTEQAHDYLGDVIVYCGYPTGPTSNGIQPDTMDPPGSGHWVNVSESGEADEDTSYLYGNDISQESVFVHSMGGLSSSTPDSYLKGVQYIMRASYPSSTDSATGEYRTLTGSYLEAFPVGSQVPSDGNYHYALHPRQGGEVAVINTISALLDHNIGCAVYTGDTNPYRCTQVCIEAVIGAPWPTARPYHFVQVI